MKPYLLPLACVSLLAFAPSSQAADAKSAAEPITSTAPASEHGLLSLNVDFQGGSVNKLLAAIAKTEGASCSIISVDESVDISHVELPPFSLRNVNVLTVVEVLRGLLEPRGFSLHEVGGGSDPNSWVCMLSRITPPAVKPAPPAQFMSYQLAPYLAEQSVDDIVGAIHAAWELDPSHDRDALHVKYHPATSILLVSGPSEAYLITQRIFGELRRTPKSPKPDQTNSPPPEAGKK